MPTRTRFIFVIVITVLILGVWGFFEDQRPSGTNTLMINGKKVHVELADTPQERGQGLSGRDPLPADTGMLFVFDRPDRPGFWMKDMHFALDFIWIDENWDIVEVAPNVLPETYPQVIQPNTPVRYVLEINAGWAARNGIVTGMKVELQ